MRIKHEIYLYLCFLTIHKEATFKKKKKKNKKKKKKKKKKKN